MNLILDLSLNGSLVFLLVWILDWRLAFSSRAADRRWWWILVPAAFLFTTSLPILAPVHGVSFIPKELGIWESLVQVDVMTRRTVQGIGLEDHYFWFWIWVAGAAIYLLIVMAQTRIALRRWSRERLCTDSGLLDLLEDCKHDAGITAPIGLVLSNHIAAPAILGWLRPRILLPHALVSSLSAQQLRAIFFHELAHFRSLDIPLHWLFTLVRVIHWFNPFAHLAFHAWARVREEAADETAMIWMKASSGAFYGQTVLQAIRHANAFAPPFGALAIGESIHNLQKRITMINYYPNKFPRFLVTVALVLVVTMGFIARPIRANDVADPKPAAVVAMQDWLTEIDEDQYEQSWKDASTSFQKAVTSDGWTAALNAVRTPLGKCTGRKLVSAFHQTEVPSPSGPQKGDFVVAQFNSSFENLAYAVETVCFEKASDGTWKASGYYVKPKL